MVRVRTFVLVFACLVAAALSAALPADNSFIDATVRAAHGHHTAPAHGPHGHADGHSTHAPKTHSSSGHNDDDDNDKDDDDNEHSDDDDNDDNDDSDDDHESDDDHKMKTASHNLVTSVRGRSRPRYDCRYICRNPSIRNACIRCRRANSK